MVTLICEGYFIKNILPLLKKSVGDLTKAHSLFRLSAANNEVMLVSRYFEADVTLFGFTIPACGIPCGERSKQKLAPALDRPKGI